jgi:hypothetical protein
VHGSQRARTVGGRFRATGGRAGGGGGFRAGVWARAGAAMAISRTKDRTKDPGTRDPRDCFI